MRSQATLAACLLLFASWARGSEQTAFKSDFRSPPSFDHQNDLSSYHDDPALFAETIVSTLSSSSRHTTLLHLLQRSKSIPLLAHIGNATLFAPTDDAWSSWAEAHRPDSDDDLVNGWLGTSGLEEWMLDEQELLRVRIEQGGGEEGERRRIDNQNWALRQHLLYHMLNYTLSPSAMIATADARNVSVETTMLFPMAEEPEHPPIPEPGSPWLPRGGEGMLGGHGQRLRVARAGSDDGAERGRIGIAWNGEKGVEVWDGSGWEPRGNETGLGHKGMKGVRWVRNGVVVGVDGVLDMPPSIEEIIQTDQALSYLSRLLAISEPLPDPLPDSLSTTPHLTIFAPSNDAFNRAFDDIEKRYLEGGYGSEGVGRVFAGGVVLGVGKEEVGWQDSWGKKGYQVESASGEGLLIDAPSNGTLVVNGTEAEAVDIFASNGVIHILPSLLLPENFTLLNSAEKALLSLNATRFVSLLRSANLSTTYVGESKTDAWTILAPTDDVLDMLDRSGEYGAPLALEAPVGGVRKRGVILPAPMPNEPISDVTPLQALLQYHIIPGRLQPADIKDGMLLGTERRTSALKGGRQRLRADVSDRFDPVDWDNAGQGEIRFGGATVIGKPVKNGKTIIYLISNLLAPPDDVLQTAVSDLQLSTFIAAVYAADLDKAVKRNPATTYFVPRNRAFTSLGLAMRYLLLPEGKDELRKVVRYHAVDGVLYTPDVQAGRQVYKTVEGGEVVLSKTMGTNSTLRLSSPSNWEGHDSGEGIPSNGELRPAKVTHFDALTDTGVIHTIDSVMIPADVSITISKLIRGSKQNTMVDLMIRAGLAWVLEGREPTSSEVQRLALQGFVRSWDNEDDDESDLPDEDLLAMPSYTVLCPTDKAFSRLNLTHFLTDKEDLVNLLKLHIIPSQPSIPRSAGSKVPAAPPQDGQPLSLGDDLVFSTLLSSASKYGDIAFRATGDNSFIVGIRNARGGLGNDAARVGAAGRASVRWRKAHSSAGSLKKKKDKTEDDDEDEVGYEALWQGGMALGGGVVMVDSVLVPYEPSWFSRWGWLVLALVGIGLVLVVAAVSFGWWWMTRARKEEGYEALEGEEEE